MESKLLVGGTVIQKCQSCGRGSGSRGSNKVRVNTCNERFITGSGQRLHVNLRMVLCDRCFKKFIRSIADDFSKECKTK